jgi:hypothetical protein
MSSMAKTTSSNFQLILNAALDQYAKQMGIDLARLSSTEQFQNCRSADDVIQEFLQSESAFTEYRDKYRNLRNCLRPVVQVVHAISGVLGEAAIIVGHTHSISIIDQVFTRPYRRHFN